MRYLQGILLLSLPLLSLPLLPPAAAQAPEQTAGRTGAVPSSYRLGPRDEIAIDVYETSDFNVRQQISEDGTITMPFVGDLEVAGRTPRELAAEIERILEADYLEKASVSVDLLAARARPISVLGAVRQPGDLGYPGRMTLIEALTLAGGLAENHGRSIQILRRAENGLVDQIQIPIDRLLGDADPTVNLPIFANDLINVERVQKINIYFLGEVASVGMHQFDSTEEVTLLTAIARAGGLSERASSKLRIRRRVDGGGTEEITVHYKRILSGDAPDVPLEHGDVIVVKESFF